MCCWSFLVTSIPFLFPGSQKPNKGGVIFWTGSFSFGRSCLILYRGLCRLVEKSSTMVEFHRWQILGLGSLIITPAVQTDGKFRIGGSDFKILRDMFLGLENMKFWNFTWGLWRWGATGFQDPSDVFFSPASEGLQRPGDSVWHQAAFFSEWKGCQCRRHQAAIFHVVQCSAICRLACGFYLASWTDLSDLSLEWYGQMPWFCDAFFGRKCMEMRGLCERFVVWFCCGHAARPVEGVGPEWYLGNLESMPRKL